MTQPARGTSVKRGGLRQQDRRALVFGAVVLALLLGYARVVRPAVAQLREQRMLLHEEQTRLARERSLLASVTSGPNAQTAIVRQLNAEGPRLFAGDSVAATAELTSYTTGIADASQLRLTSVEAHAPRTTQGITTLAIDVRGEGSWRNALAFAHSMESATRLVDIQSLRIERGARGGPLGGDLVAVSATLSGYSRSAP